MTPTPSVAPGDARCYINLLCGAQKTFVFSLRISGVIPPLSLSMLLRNGTFRYDNSDEEAPAYPTDVLDGAMLSI